ncbi:MAG TPA: ribosome assembly cofactor RimP [Bacteroidia bacterium]|nr:ribosome assembly cofactor RimP [Bacteroidia bacterium]
MITSEHIAGLAEQKLKDTGLFVTGVRVSADNHIRVFIDGDNGVSIRDCVELSRAIESALNLENLDFALDVSSHGADTPLVMPRQYKKHLGRELEVKLIPEGQVSGLLLDCDNEGIVVQTSSREPKPLGKGKTTVLREHRILFKAMKETRIKLKY